MVLSCIQINKGTLAGNQDSIKFIRAQASFFCIYCTFHTFYSVFTKIKKKKCD